MLFGANVPRYIFILLVLLGCNSPGTNLLPPWDIEVTEPETWDLGDLSTDYDTAYDITTQEIEVTEPETWDLGDLSTDYDTVYDITTQEGVLLVTNQYYAMTLFNLIENASESIQIATLEILNGTLPDQLVMALEKAVSRGVDVRVLLDDKVEENASHISTLTSAGVKARLDSASRTLHVKLVVIDRKRVLVGSSNISQASMKYNNETNFLFDLPEVAERFAQYHDKLWVSDSSTITIDPTPILNIVPIGDTQYHDLVYPLLKAAKTRVRVIMYQADGTGDPSDPQMRLLMAVGDAQARGLDVKVILENDPLGTDNSAAREKLLDRQVQVRVDPSNITTHAKLVIADDSVVIYSGNWTYSGMNLNHEAGAIVNSSLVTGQALEYFDTLWAVSK